MRVATPNLLYSPFTRGVPAPAGLRAVQRRREFPMNVIQKMQIIVQNNVIGRALRGTEKMRAPRLLRFLAAIPYLRRFPAYFTGVGPRPEHIGTPERLPS